MPAILPRKRGRPKKTTIEQLAEFEKEREEREMVIALNNPIRRQFATPRDPLIDTALGRFCIQHKLRREIFDSGELYAKTRRKIVSAWGGPMADQPDSAGGDVPMAILKGWEQDVFDWELAITESSIEGVAVLGWIGVLCFDDKDIAPYMRNFYVIEGLLALAVATGKLDKKALARA
jgi:hypothetical protein